MTSQASCLGLSLISRTFILNLFGSIHYLLVMFTCRPQYHKQDIPNLFQSQSYKLNSNRDRVGSEEHEFDTWLLVSNCFIWTKINIIIIHEYLMALYFSPLLLYEEVS